MKATKAQKKATEKWRKNNPDSVKYSNYKSHAKTFINELATRKDLVDLKGNIEDKLNK